MVADGESNGDRDGAANRDSLRRGRSNLSAGIGGGFGPGFGFRSREIDPRRQMEPLFKAQFQVDIKTVGIDYKRRWCESWLRLGERTLSRYDVALICSKQVSAAAGLMPPLLRASQIGKGVKLTATYLWRGRDAIRHEDSGNWALNIGTGIGIIEESACERSKVEKERKRRNREIERKREETGGSGNGVRHLTGGWRGKVKFIFVTLTEHLIEIISFNFKFTTQCHETLEKSIPLAAQSQCRCNSFAWELHPTETAALRYRVVESDRSMRVSLRAIGLRAKASPLPESMISSAEYLTEDEWDDLDAVSPPSRRGGRGDHDTTSLRILADILGYSSADGHESYEKDLIKAMVIRETVRRMYTRKKLDEMMVVCESFLEHLRVQSQVLVSALELTWPPAGWALCRPSQPPPYLPGESHASSKCLSSVRHYYWPSKFRPRGDQAQEHVSTTDPRIKGSRFKGRSLKCDCWSSVTVSSANNQGKSSCSRSLLISHSL
ncbi:hypothetical protein ALC57_11281 [Trachymyrmex cornetzi]|uniref:Uncharacterized protein n=1 Tax=Trachymyrmex cornetzi TaxID=471704 RepID=A0A195DU79_9HYME|nr:hypothetical protein ALC57_11281 [Trachymyrmex cornetzi]